MDRAKAALDALNRHSVFNVGLGSGLLAVATIFGAPALDALARAHADPATATIVHGYALAAVAAAQAALAPALVAAGFSRPPNVPPGPVAR